MRYLLLGAFMYGAASTSNGETIGVSIGVVLDTTTISLPIEVSGSTRIVPFASLRRNKFSSAESNRSSYRDLSLGAALLKEVPLEGSLSLLYGARFAYLESAGSNEYRPAGGGLYGESTKERGFGAAPVVGLEYKLTDRISILGEVSYDYLGLRGTRQTTDGSSFATSRSFGQTSSMIRLQYMNR